VFHKCDRNVFGIQPRSLARALRVPCHWRIELLSSRTVKSLWHIAVFPDRCCKLLTRAPV
jgi:hypothetical protein